MGHSYSQQEFSEDGTWVAAGYTTDGQAWEWKEVVLEHFDELKVAFAAKKNGDYNQDLDDVTWFVSDQCAMEPICTPSDDLFVWAAQPVEIGGGATRRRSGSAPRRVAIHRGWFEAICEGRLPDEDALKAATQRQDTLKALRSNAYA